ncbi:hypothetical protein DVH24_026309 [Malus domestica]|uniref:Methionine aminopeptidase n=1 Tax=Malus domestica TaxID=3750 RepID=A0A498KPF6_MALDO|nr:hypothetical protein DVH24_026309 [Malus domestica]
MIIEYGFDENPFLVTKLVQMYADCDDLVSAWTLFDKLLNPNVFAWTAILGFYSRHGMYEKCVRAYGEMILKGVLPDGYVFPKVLKACSQLSSVKVGFLVHKDVIIRGFELNVQVCNSLIDMYSKCKDVRSAKQVFDEMVERDLLSWNFMISGYVCNGMLGLAVELFDCMHLDVCEPDVVTLNTVMDAYCRLGHCDEAKRIFEQIKDPNIISWTTLISGFSRIGNHESSLKIFRDMMDGSRVYPDLDSLSAVIVSCRHLGSLLNGKEIHGYGIKIGSGIAFYSSAGPALLILYANCSRIQDAINVFRLMNPADVVSWNAMILGFIDLGLGDLALECFRKMQRAQLPRKFSGLTNLLFNGRNVDTVVNKRKRLRPGKISPQRPVPDHIPRPPYVKSKKSPGIASGPEVHDEKGIECMRASGRLAAQVLEHAGTLVKPGTKTDEIDQAVHQMIIDNGAYPSPLGYGGFPKSVCTSVNECICHGIPDSRALEDGDIVNIDVTVYLNGYHGDTSTTFFCGDVDNEARKLVQVTKECLDKAISICAPGVEYKKIGKTIQDHADKNRYGVVRQFVGHGVGRVFHADPVILHFRNNDSGRMLLNQTFTIEPMLTMGSYNAVMWDDNWTVVTEDGSLSAQFEHTILITEDGAEILTQC